MSWRQSFVYMGCSLVTSYVAHVAPDYWPIGVIMGCLITIGA